jgi:hypothetical protein
MYFFAFLLTLCQYFFSSTEQLVNFSLLIDNHGSKQQTIIRTFIKSNLTEIEDLVCFFFIEHL